MTQLVISVISNELQLSQPFLRGSQNCSVAAATITYSIARLPVIQRAQFDTTGLNKNFQNCPCDKKKGQWKKDQPSTA